MQVDAAFRDWWVNCLGSDPVPPDYVIPIQHNLQGHPKGPHIWHKHIDKILKEDLDFTTTTHEPCLYFKRDQDNNLIILLPQVDDFIIATKDVKTCTDFHNQLQSHMKNPSMTWA